MRGMRKMTINRLKELLCIIITIIVNLILTQVFKINISIFLLLLIDLVVIAFLEIIFIKINKY